MTPLRKRTNFASSLCIGERRIGPNHRPFIIAELSGNHNGSLNRAIEIVDAAAEAGVDAVKLQTYTADTMTLDLNRGDFFLRDKNALWKGTTLHALYRQAHTPWHWHRAIFDRCRQHGILGFSSAFDATSVNFLANLRVPAFKIASFEIGDLPLIRKAAATGKPLIISTGMATLEEIAHAVGAARETGCPRPILLKCTSSYPASPRDSNLAAIPAMREAFGTEVGLSDHTLGVGAAVASVALGATVVEKHIVLKRSEGGVDAAFSLEPDEMRQLVKETRAAWEALGSVRFGPTPAESWSLRFRRSLYFVRPLHKGQRVSRRDIRSIRPAGGLAPDHIGIIIGRSVRRAIIPGTPVTWSALA